LGLKGMNTGVGEEGIGILNGKTFGIQAKIGTILFG
jgi:hypothetical protein